MNKKLILTAIIAMAIILFMQIPTLAYQSTSKGAPLENRVSNSSSETGWATGIRQMEASGAGMGLNETTLNTTTLVSGASNNIDVHLQKSTEHGAMLILGASNYGKQGDLTTSSTTTRFMHKGARTLTGTDKKASSTGNVYGVYELGYESVNKTATGRAQEWVAGGREDFLYEVNSRYKNIYEGKNGITGDATIEGDIDFATWHGGVDSDWLTSSRLAGFIRSGYSNGAVFERNSSSQSEIYYARAVIVNGVGF